jgi:hypothetical protein
MNSVQAGDRVLFTPMRADPIFQPDKTQQLTGIVAVVIDEHHVNLNVLDQNGMSHARGGVLLLGEDDVAPSADNTMFAERYQP